MAEEDETSGQRPEKSRREAPAGGPGGGSPLARREEASQCLRMKYTYENRSVKFANENDSPRKWQLEQCPNFKFADKSNSLIKFVDLSNLNNLLKELVSVRLSVRLSRFLKKQFLPKMSI